VANGKRLEDMLHWNGVGPLLYTTAAFYYHFLLLILLVTTVIY